MRELVVGRLTKVWGGSSTGRASVLQAEGCGFKSRPLHGAARGVGYEVELRHPIFCEIPSAWRIP